MSVTTFDDVKGHDVKQIRKALEGAVFAKRWEEGDDAITQIFTDDLGLIIPSGYMSVGLLSKSSAVTLARDTGSSEVESWGVGEPTRIDLTTDSATMKFTMQESKRIAFELYNGVDLSQVTSDADNNIIIDKPSRPQKLDWRIFALSKDGDGENAIYFLKWLPNCSITAIEDQTLSEEDALTYTVTASGLTDPVVKTAVREVWGGPGLDPTAMGFTA